ncbi:MAG: TVP38/TMEM64 family protein [Sporomusaceae bacterium]|nr:TVP38/TMEM64 family protein [Sporomusaceae bacterium]
MKTINQTALRFIVVLVVILLGVMSYQLNPDFFTTAGNLLVSGDIVGLIDFIRSYGPYAMVISFFLVVFINIVAVLPNIFILAANGILFGVVEGTILSWLAESVGVIISFAVMRYLFHDYAHNLIVRSNALKKVDEFSGKKGFRIMLIARSIPYIPSGLITALGAVSSITFWDYAAATLIGKLPSAWIEVTLGHDLMAYREHSFRLLVLVVISCLAYYFFLRYKKTVSEKNS